MTISPRTRRVIRPNVHPLVQPIARPLGDPRGNKLCLSLNGSGYASHADDPALDMGVGDFMVETWIKWNGTINGSASDAIFGKSYTTPYWYATVNSSGSVVWSVRPLGAAAGITAAILSNIIPGRWYHLVCFTDRSGNIGLIVDGVADNTGDISGDSGTVDNAIAFTLASPNNMAGAATLGLFDGQIALSKLFYFGKDGLDPTEAATYAEKRFADPYGDLEKVMPDWAGYADAVYTDTHDGAGSVTGLVVGMWYEFQQGTVGHNLDYGGGTLTSTGVFQATQATGTISSGDANDHVRRTGLRASWSLDGDYTDDMSNGLDLTEAGTGNRFTSSDVIFFTPNPRR